MTGVAAIIPVYFLVTPRSYTTGVKKMFERLTRPFPVPPLEYRP